MFPARRPGMTMMELTIVMVILVALAAIIVPMFSGTTQDAQATTTRATLQDLAKVIARYRADNLGQLPAPGFVGTQPPFSRPGFPQLRYLFVNPGSATTTDPLAETATPSYSPFSKIGWNGPYLLGGIGAYKVDAAHGFTTNYGLDNDPCVLDGWLHPVVLIQFTDASGMTHAWLQSAGPNGTLDLPAGITGPPTPVTPSSTISSGTGSVFPTSSGTVTVDDLTFVVQ